MDAKMLLEAKNIHKAYGSQTVLGGVNLTLESGESLALTGESGSGKSTLIHILAALDEPDQGQVILGGTQVDTLSETQRAKLRRQEIGIVFQQFNLVPSMTAGANLAFQAEIADRYDPDWTEELGERLGIADHLHKFPEELSGGQQQRVAIGRALAPRPKIVLADEPTGNLDELAADKTLELMQELVTTSGAGLIMATHSHTRADRLDRKIHLSHGVLS